MNNTPPLNDKRYGTILRGYSFESELNPTAMRYNDAIEYAKKVLPDDIKEERKKYDDNTGISYVIYTSEKGRFIVGINSIIKSITNGKYNYDNEHICGIFYMKEK